VSTLSAQLPHLAVAGRTRPARLRDYLVLTKPKVSLMIAFTSVVGMALAVPRWVPWIPLIFGTLGIALASGSAAAFNHILDQHIDEQMARTRFRPLPTGVISRRAAVAFASALGVASMVILWPTVGALTATLTFASLIGYAIVYTLWLKRATSQNIVIGGAAPPVLGWAAVTHTIDPHALILFLIVFTWTPPHFWALAIARRNDYAKANVPMLPVTHGVPFTCRQILLYTVLLALATLLPVLTGMSGLLYLAVAVILNARFVYYAIELVRDRQGERAALPMRTFRYSINYLMWLFAALILDHYLLIV
jgi:heme o synthase